LNVLTREIPYEKTLFADVSVGQWNTLKTHAYSGVTGDSTGVLIEGVNVRSDGFKELDPGGETGVGRSEFMLKSEWLVRADHRLELKLGYATEQSHETYLGLSASDWEQSPYRRYAASSLGDMEWNRTQAELEWSGRLGSNVRIRSVAYHHWLDRSWTKLNGFSGGTDLHALLQKEPGGQAEVLLAILRGEENSETPGQLLQIGTNEREFHSYGLQTTARWRMEPMGENVRSVLEGGVRIHGDHVRRLHTEDPHAMLEGVLEATGTETITMLDSEATAHALALHLHEELSIRDLHIFPGARLEVVRGWREDVGSEAADAITRMTPLPGLGLLWEPGEGAGLFLGAHRGFSPVAPGQPESVEPESSWNYELGARFDTGVAYGEAVGFYNDYTNITGQCTFSGGCTGDDVDRQFNGGAAQVYGAEVVAGAEVGLVGGLRLPVEMSYALTRSAFTTNFVSSFPQFGSVEAGESLPYVPEHQAGLRGGVAHPRWSVSAGITGRSGMLDQAGSLDELQIPELWLVDLAVQAQISKALAMYATGANLTGEDAITSWRPFGARPTPPRHLAVGLKGTLGAGR
ncbi:MAG: TonB-dependent receptor, partial [Myxococcota bacterium]|nr:TonB-dependent receptor [Myxococcota bacterium]